MILHLLQFVSKAKKRFISSLNRDNKHMVENQLDQKRQYGAKLDKFRTFHECKKHFKQRRWRNSHPSMLCTQGCFNKINKSIKRKSKQPTDESLSAHKWTTDGFTGSWLILSRKEKLLQHVALGAKTCRSRLDLTETPHCEAWTWLCQHLMDRFPLRSLLRPRSPGAVASSFAQHVGLGPARGVISASVVLFQARCGGAAKRIVLPSWGYCPTPMCLFMLLASLSGQPQFYATRLLVPTVVGPPGIRPVASKPSVRVCQGW